MGPYFRASGRYEQLSAKKRRNAGHAHWFFPDKHGLHLRGRWRAGVSLPASCNHQSVAWSGTLLSGKRLPLRCRMSKSIDWLGGDIPDARLRHENAQSHEIRGAGAWTTDKLLAVTQATIVSIQPDDLCTRWIRTAYNYSLAVNILQTTTHPSLAVCKEHVLIWPPINYG